jgi:hypothetical protein
MRLRPWNLSKLNTRALPCTADSGTCSTASDSIISLAPWKGYITAGGRAAHTTTSDQVRVRGRDAGEGQSWVRVCVGQLVLSSGGDVAPVRTAGTVCFISTDVHLLVMNHAYCSVVC